MLSCTLPFSALAQSLPTDKAVNSNSKPASTSSAGKVAQSFINSLGAKFVTAGTNGVWFSIWDVRVRDYSMFVKETGHEWRKPEFTQTDNDPVVNVSWTDAHAFCEWLTKKEQVEGKLTSTQKYRLPTDAEWSVAVGLPDEGIGTPQAKDEKIKGIYPWGNEFPPPTGAGNYCGEETKKKHPAWNYITGYNDGYVETSPVGSFNANKYGLYDMGGNVWQWCEDEYDPPGKNRTLRGASWDFTVLAGFLSSYRLSDIPACRCDGTGFRMVINDLSPTTLAPRPAADKGIPGSNGNATEAQRQSPMNQPPPKEKPVLSPPGVD